MSAIMRGNLRMALAGVRGAKWRSLLTMLGVIIGIVSVVTVVGIGEGIKQQVGQQLNHFGKDLITVRPGVIDETRSSRVLGSSDILFGMGAMGGFNARDVQVVREVPEVGSVVPLGVVPGQVQADDRTLNNGVLLATSSNMANMLHQRMAFGQFWQAQDEESNYAVLGRHAAQTLFNEQVPLGKRFTFRGESFIVRGILDEFNNQPLSPTAEFDNAVFIPYLTAARLTNGNSHLYVILAKPKDRAALPAAVDTITDHLRESHAGARDFTVLLPEQNLASSSRLLDMLTTWIMAVGAIALLIGGVGIMNIMLLNVTERMHEIGVRKAIGATSRQILGQFLLEAIVLSVLGGIVGIMLALLTNFLLRTYTALQPIISWRAIAVATLTSLVIGVVFGILPAIKAARKDPINALRHE